MMSPRCLCPPFLDQLIYHVGNLLGWELALQQWNRLSKEGPLAVGWPSCPSGTTGSLFWNEIDISYSTELQTMFGAQHCEPTRALPYVNDNDIAFGKPLWYLATRLLWG